MLANLGHLPLPFRVPDHLGAGKARRLADQFHAIIEEGGRVAWTQDDLGQGVQGILLLLVIGIVVVLG